MQHAFNQASAQTHHDSVRRLAAGQTIELHIIGKRLNDILSEPFTHHPLSTEPPSFTLLAWDQSAADVPLPPALWEWPKPQGPAKVALPMGCDDFRLMYHTNGDALILYHIHTHTAIMWTRDSSSLPLAWHGAPLLEILHSFYQETDQYLIHAGCVGTAQGAVILAGKGGSGKSTTSLLCLESGMSYLSDDYCLCSTGKAPLAHGLYNTGKLHRNHLVNFPELAAIAIDPLPKTEDKVIFYPHHHRPSQLATTLPIRAVLLPTIRQQTAPQIHPIAPVEALRGLAPSTLFQLPGQGSKHFQAMAALVRQVPCFRLELGSDFPAIPAEIRSLLKKLSPDSPI